jgi:DNA-directed RNA polymerase specialized sigma24 family protein
MSGLHPSSGSYQPWEMSDASALRSERQILLSYSCVTPADCIWESLDHENRLRCVRDPIDAVWQVMSAQENRLVSREEQDLQIRIAVACAGNGDPWGMLEHLQRTNVLAGIKIAFRHKWQGLPDEEVDDIVGRGVDALYDKIARGGEVANPVGYILEVMRHEAYDYAAEHSHTVRLDDDRDFPEADQSHSPLDFQQTDAALATARALIPRLGQESVQAVMRRIFDAVEDGDKHISTAEIAAATGLSDDTVRQCRSRGFRRLERIIGDEGLTPRIRVTNPTSTDETNERSGQGRVS